MASLRTHYDTLGVSPEVAADELRSAWKVLVQVWHPDRFDGELREHAQAQTARINEAYHVLRDTARRATYDDRLAYEAGSSSGSSAASASVRVQQSPASEVREAQREANGHLPARAVGDVSALGALGDFARAFEEAARRYPRVVGALAACLLLLFGGGCIYAQTAGPQIPASRLATAAAAAPARAGSTGISGATDTRTSPTDSAAGTGDDTLEERDRITKDDSFATDGEPEWKSRTGAVRPQTGADAAGARRGRSLAPSVPEQYAVPPAEPTAPDWQEDPYAEPPPIPQRIIRVTPKRLR